MLRKQLVSVTAVAVLTTGVAFAAVQQDRVMYRQADGTYVCQYDHSLSKCQGL